MSTKAKYATPEEARAAVAKASKARWADPVAKARNIKALKAASAKRLASLDCLCGETLAQFLREYVEPDPTGRRRYRYTKNDIARRYLIEPGYVWHLANRHGARRNLSKHPRYDLREAA